MTLPLSANSFSTLQPSSTKEWYEWLSQEEAKTFAVYKEKPNLLIADYVRERDITRDYEGREIFELLQNANDQAAEAGVVGEVVIELKPDGLVVANTGTPFSTEGVESLQTSSFSPKRMRCKQIIGSKGLGFRAILNWSRTPIILSGSLCLAYSYSHAQKKMIELMGISSDLRDLIRKEQQEKDSLILPLLSFPFFSQSGDLSACLSSTQGQHVLERCQRLLSNGYDTAIGMPFDRPEAYEAAKAQLNELRPEILLFTQNLSEMCLRIDGLPDRTWKMEKKDRVTRVICNGDALGEWRIYLTKGILPAEIQDSERDAVSEFEIIIAVPTILSSRIASPLFSFFPTNIILPLPIVCHATLDLEQNRKRIQQGRKGNEYVLSRLVQFLAEIAEKTTSLVTDDPWAGCSLLQPLSNFPDDLRRVGFQDQLILATQSRNIVPTLQGSFVSPKSARLIRGANCEWLPAILFPKVALLRNQQDFDFLQSLNVPVLEASVIKRKFLSHTELDLEKRVALITGIIHNGLPSEVCTSALFMNNLGEQVQDDMRVFISPGSGTTLKLPKWAKLHFLSEEMRTSLVTSLQVRDNRELQQKLTDFGLLEYSMASVISTLIAIANKRIKKQPSLGKAIEQELLETIFSLYCTEKQRAKRPEFPEKSTLSLKNQIGESVPTTKLYFGEGFGTQGEIVQALYAPWATEKLVDPMELSELTNDKELLKEFLLWVGVAEWPRYTILKGEDHRYLDYLLSWITYPVKFDDYTYNSRQEVERPSLDQVKSIDGISEILCKSDPFAITSWLALDARVLSWQRSAKDHTRLRVRPHQVWYHRIYHGDLPSYLGWLLETTAWLVDQTEKYLRPKDCVLGERASESLFPRPAMANQDYLNHYGVRSADIIEGWRRAGVLTSLANLELDEIYAKLLELPDRSPDGTLARPLYHWLLDLSDALLGEPGIHYQEFMSCGKMWGRLGTKEDYFPVQELHHVDTEGLPQVLLQNLKIVDLRKRIGADKVQKLFGVKPVNTSEIQKEVLDSSQIAVGSNELDKNFQVAKPYLFNLRASQNSQPIYLQTLKDLQLMVCTNLRARITYLEESFEFGLRVWEWLIQDNTLYICVDPADPLNISRDMLADAIGDALASIFRISDGGEFARMILCNEKDRLMLLRKIRGEAAIEDIETITEKFRGFSAASTKEPSFPVIEPSPQKTPTPSESSDIAAQPPEEPPTGAAKSLEIISQPHIPTSIPAAQSLQIKRVIGVHSEQAKAHKVTDGDFCEQKALEFERADDPPRFPLLVSNITGSEGPKCDILSFATDEAKEAFREGPVRDLNTVVRFIEVKGRSDRAAAIELAGNELAAAENYGSHYYIYRLSETDHGNFVLAILQDPLKNKDALRPVIHVSLESALATQRFTLSGGIQKE